MHPSLLHEFFDAHWADHPDRLAVDVPPGPNRSSRVSATYGELARHSWAVTRRLRGRAAPDSVVAVLLPRTSVEAFATVIGVLRAGAAYAAIDPAFPDGRIVELIRDACAATVITDADGADRLARAGIEGELIMVAGREGAEADSSEREAAPAWLTPASLAYVIYTSGTTGRPKGVMTEHRAIANLVASDLQEFGLEGDDRVGQSSSLAYDSSIEEMWLAFAAGATLVVLDDDVARAGPDLIPWLEREAITVLCPPPTLLRATGRRSSAALLPKLRLVYVGGEALTTDVVDVWAPGRRFVNGYGPTESAVTSVRTDVIPGQPIPIGHPIPHVSACVLNDSLGDCADDEVGELWLGGAGLARGYWRDPELTARKFSSHPRLGRLYRTGDRARRTSDGTIYCLGRADSQVKLRGYRIELEEIEARLASLPLVRAAACRIQGQGNRQAIVGFVVATDPKSPPVIDDLRRRLAVELPTYMVPSAIRVVDALPTTTGGKLDRAALPVIENEHQGSDPFPPRTDLESRIEAALRRVLERNAPISVTTHFFHDLGGDSLLAAELITALRADPDTAGLTVRDAYASPTIEQLAATAAALRPATAAARPAEQPRSSGRPLLATLIQLMWLIAEVVVPTATIYLFVVMAWPRVATGATAGALAAWIIVLGLAGFAVYLPVSIALAVTVKRLVMGRYEATRAPVWGSYYVRHWIVCQTLRLVPWRVLEGTTIQLVALRALGARIGQRVHIHRGVDLLQGGWDLLDIGDDVTIGQEAVVRLVDLEDEQIVVGPIVIGSGSTFDIRSSIAGHTVVEPGGFLTALSSLPAGARIPAGQQWDGVPARHVGPAPEPPAIDPNARVLSPFAHGAAMLISRLVSALVLPAIGAAAFVWLSRTQGISSQEFAAWMRAPTWRGDVLLLLVWAALIAVPTSVTVQALTIRLLGRVAPGVMSRWSPAYLRVWAKTDLVRRAGDWLSGTLMWPIWLRAAGMHIGKDCEISTIIDVVPELVTIGAGTFFADGVYLAGPRLHRGTVTLAATSLGSDVFLGNHVVIPAGSRVRDGILIGVSTVANDEDMAANTSWFGHPPFSLARPPAAYVDRSLTHHPSAIRYVNRWVWELARFGIPVVPALVLLGFADSIVLASRDLSVMTMAIVVAPALVIAMGVLLSAIVLAMKWLLLGRVRPGQHALWSCWCSRWDFHYVAWGRLARPFLARFDGTLLLAWYLRAMGMRIGRRVVLGPGFAQVVDPDMIRIDDDATVHALFQAHTFEDRMLKIDRIRIRRRATVGCGAVLFYGADIGEGSSVAAQSVIMKHERLAPHQRFEGCPSASVPLPR